MKTTLYVLAITCGARLLLAQTPAPKVAPPAATPAPLVPAPPAAATTWRPLDATERKSWKIGKGEWKFEENTLEGTGASGIVFQRAFKPPFSMSFEFEMVEGNRPRILGFGRYSVMDEGGGLAIYPRLPKTDVFPFKLKRKYRVRIDITAESMELRINSKVIETRKPGLELIGPISFSAGDGSSPGIAHFSAIEITAPPAAVPQL